MQILTPIPLGTEGEKNGLPICFRDVRLELNVVPQRGVGVFGDDEDTRLPEQIENLASSSIGLDIVLWNSQFNRLWCRIP